MIRNIQLLHSNILLPQPKDIDISLLWFVEQILWLRDPYDLFMRYIWVTCAVRLTFC